MFKTDFYADGTSFGYVSWSSDGSCVVAGISKESAIDIPGSERSVTPLPTTDANISPDGHWRLEKVDTGGPIDVFVTAVGSPSGSGTNVSLQDERT